MGKYAKLIVAAVGVVAVVLVDFTGIVADGTTVESLTQSIIGALTLFGVYQIPNKGA